MTQEEKLIKAKKLYETANADQRYLLESLFPEILEDEDERIRKSIICGMNALKDQKKYFFATIPIDDCITWLEKQDEHKDYYTKQELIDMGFSFTLNGDIVTPDEMMEDMKKYLVWKEKQGNKEYVLKSSKDEDILKFVQYIEKEAKAYEFNLPNRGYDIYAFAKDILTWLEKQGKYKSQEEVLKIRQELYQSGYNDGYKHGCKDTQVKQKPFDYENINIKQKDFAPKPAMEAIHEEKVDNANKVEPKFKVGDWCIDNEDGTIFQIVKVLDNTYIYKTTEGSEYSCTHYSLENDAKLWTIQDAKDGDVLVEDSCIFIIQKLGDNSTAAKTYCTLYNDGDFDDGSILYFDVDSTKPATKEQRDVLMKAMTDAGYAFDFDKNLLTRNVKNG